MHPIHSNNEVYFMAYQGRTLTFLGVPWLNRVGKRCDSFSPLVTEMGPGISPADKFSCERQ